MLMNIIVMMKVEHGRDKAACHKARGGVMENSEAFYLETGGDDDDQREECKHNTKLCLMP